MTRDRLNKNIRERLKDEFNLEASKELVAAILNIEEDEVYQIIALEDSIRYIWGTIKGVQKIPKRIAGFYTEYKNVQDNHGYSRWKLGYPEVKFSSAAKLCDSKPAWEYFELPEQRYTTAARTFRKDLGLPEIPEYEGLSEEDIEKYCKRADDINFKLLPAYKQWRKTMDARENGLKQKLLYQYWKESGYVPMGAYPEHYEGRQRDSIDQYLKKRIVEGMDPVEGLDYVLNAKDIMDYREMDYSRHPEVAELEAKFRKEIEEKGLEPKEHRVMFKKDADAYKIKWKFEGENNPWGLIPLGELKKKELSKEEIQLKRQNLIEELAKIELEQEIEADKEIEDEKIQYAESKRLIALTAIRKQKNKEAKEQAEKEARENQEAQESQEEQAKNDFIKETERKQQEAIERTAKIVQEQIAKEQKEAEEKEAKEAKEADTSSSNK